MKVKIGKYVDRFRWGVQLEDWYYKKIFPEDYWDRDAKDFGRFGKTFIWFTDQLQILLNMTLNKIQDKKKRKVKVVIDDYDTWNADHTLGLIILPVLKKLREDKMGIPFVDKEDAPADFFEEKKDPTDPDGFSERAWDYVLGEMIWTFEQLTDETSEDEFFKEVESDDVLGKYELDREGYDKREVRIKNGLRLFGKYYRALWT